MSLRQVVPHDHVANLLHLRGLGSRAEWLKIEDFRHSVSRKNMMIATNPLLKA